MFKASKIEVSTIENLIQVFKNMNQDNQRVIHESKYSTLGRLQTSQTGLLHYNTLANNFLRGFWQLKSWGDVSVSPGKQNLKLSKEQKFKKNAWSPGSRSNNFNCVFLSTTFNAPLVVTWKTDFMT